MPLLHLTEWPLLAGRLLIIGAGLSVAMAVAVALGRMRFAHRRYRRRHLEARYQRLIRRALGGDQEAVRTLAASPKRHHLDIAELLIEPLIDDRGALRIARTRAVVEALTVTATVYSYLGSFWWWRRAVALRVLGLLRMTDRTPHIIAALDDDDDHVRGAALDALGDLGTRDALVAVVQRLTDPSLHVGRRAAALMSFGSAGEPLVLELGHANAADRARYARALIVCGTAKSRPALCDWTHDARVEVQAAALEALARVGLDDAAARRAIECLEHHDARVRAMAAQALRGWSGSAYTAAQLARHLDDVWIVAVRSAHALRAMRPYGLDALRRRAAQDGIAGTLARQMLWEERLPA